MGQPSLEKKPSRRNLITAQKIQDAGQELETMGKGPLCTDPCGCGGFCDLLPWGTHHWPAVEPPIL